MKPTIYIPSHLAKLFFVCMQREVLGTNLWPSTQRRHRVTSQLRRVQGTELGNGRVAGPIPTFRRTALIILHVPGTGCAALSP